MSYYVLGNMTRVGVAAITHIYQRRNVIVIAMLFGAFLSIFIGDTLHKNDYNILSLICYMGGIFFVIYMASLL